MSQIRRTSLISKEEKEMEEPTVVSPREARRKTESGLAKLVCAYEDELKCKMVHLEDGVSLKDFRSQSAALPKDQEIIFYCA
jgi:hypothetical protein